METKKAENSTSRVHFDRLIEQCYSIDSIIEVKGNGDNFASLCYGVYTLNGTIKPKTLRALKEIFYGLAVKYQAFYFNGVTYNIHDPKWHKLIDL